MVACVDDGAKSVHDDRSVPIVVPDRNVTAQEDFELSPGAGLMLTLAGVDLDGV
ncbi:MAG: hypothetical protein ACJATT_003767, partial [Myxococcota bacterium]